MDRKLGLLLGDSTSLELENIILGQEQRLEIQKFIRKIELAAPLYSTISARVNFNGSSFMGFISIYADSFSFENQAQSKELNDIFEKVELKLSDQLELWKKTKVNQDHQKRALA